MIKQQIPSIKTAKRLLVFVLALAAVGCTANYGTPTVNDYGRFTQIEARTSTKSDVHRLFGQPHDVRHVPLARETIWTYYDINTRINPLTAVPFVSLVAGGTDIDYVAASFKFNEDGVLMGATRGRETGFKNGWSLAGDTLTASGQALTIEAEMKKEGLPYDAASAKEAASFTDIYAR